MRKKIVQRFHSLKGKMNKAFEETVENVPPAGRSGVEQTDTANREARKTVRNAAVKLMERGDFEKIVGEELRAGHRAGGLLICDVDRFREIHDIYGQDACNALLRHVADVLFDKFAEAAYMVRQGRDTFAIWLPGVSAVHADVLCRQAGEVNDLLLHPAGGIPPVTLSCGIAFCTAADDYRSLGRKAVKALNRVKECGRCGCRIYDDREDGANESTIPGLKKDDCRQHSSRAL